MSHPSPASHYRGDSHSHSCHAKLKHHFNEMSCCLDLRCFGGMAGFPARCRGGSRSVSEPIPCQDNSFYLLGFKLFGEEFQGYISHARVLECLPPTLPSRVGIQDKTLHSIFAERGWEEARFRVFGYNITFYFRQLLGTMLQII